MVTASDDSELAEITVFLLNQIEFDICEGVPKILKYPFR